MDLEYSAIASASYFSHLSSTVVHNDELQLASLWKSRECFPCLCCPTLSDVGWVCQFCGAEAARSQNFWPEAELLESLGSLRRLLHEVKHRNTVHPNFYLSLEHYMNIYC